jgi:hypothetical protein
MSFRLDVIRGLTSQNVPSDCSKTESVQSEQSRPTSALPKSSPSSVPNSRTIILSPRVPTTSPKARIGECPSSSFDDVSNTSLKHFIEAVTHTHCEDKNEEEDGEESASDDDDDANMLQVAKLRINKWSRDR